MRAAMHSAEVGDDVFHEDPTVNRLEERVAALLGKEASLYVPSGTMSNQIGVKTHTQPGDELICETHCHIYNNEAGGPAALSGVTCRTFEGDYGILDITQLDGKIRPNNEHQVRTRLVCLENTHNRGGGRIYPLEKIQAISAWTHAHNLLLHLDGARLWNAIVATGISAQEWTKPFDSVSVCFSKGLGAPVGSALTGSKEFITRARRVRKLFGGGMRQAGVLAAAGLIALEESPKGLPDDHANAKLLAEGLAELPGIKIDPEKVVTNIVIFEVSETGKTADVICAQLRERGVLASGFGSSIRMVTHYDVSRADIETALRELKALLNQSAATRR
jgi:threonine aldolase